ncbi:MAG: methyltransferase domain-containing protein [FCB group bacterium]|nr:methyltransferase domain-containing protein [FCB group bacterium]
MDTRGGEGQIHAMLDKLAALLPRGARVLDIGAGRGENMVRLLESGLEVHGCDPDAAVAQRLRAEVGARYQGACVFEREAKQVVDWAGNYDAVIFVKVLHLLERDAALELIEALARAMSAGAYLLLSSFLLPAVRTGLNSTRAVSIDAWPCTIETGELAPFLLKQGLEPVFFGECMWDLESTGGPSQRAPRIKAYGTYLGRKTPGLDNGKDNEHGAAG